MQLLPALAQPDQSLHSAILKLVFLFAVMAIGSGILLYQNHRRQRSYARRLQDQQEQFGRELFASQREVERETRQRIAADLHDNAVYLVRSALNELEGILADTADPHHVAVLRAAVLLERHKSELRGFSHALENDDPLPLGLHGAIREEVKRIGRWRKPEVVADLPEDDNTPFGRGEEILLFRIFQESVNNIRKHAGATRITVLLTYDADGLTLGIADNGKGFNVTAQAGKAVGGLAHLHRRAALLGATLCIRSDPAIGTAIELRMPVPQKET